MPIFQGYWLEKKQVSESKISLRRLRHFKKSQSTVSTIAEASRKSRKTVRRNLLQFLDSYSAPKPVPNLSCCLIIDATCFKRNHCLLVYWDHDRHRVQWWRYATSENGVEISQDLRSLEDNGVVCASITAAGGKGINTAVNLVYPDIPNQRCLVHNPASGFGLVDQKPQDDSGSAD